MNSDITINRSLDCIRPVRVKTTHHDYGINNNNNKKKRNTTTLDSMNWNTSNESIQPISSKTNPPNKYNVTVISCSSNNYRRKEGKGDKSAFTGYSYDKIIDSREHSHITYIPVSTESYMVPYNECINKSYNNNKRRESSLNQVRDISFSPIDISNHRREHYIELSPADSASQFGFSSNRITLLSAADSDNNEQRFCRNNTNQQTNMNNDFEKYKFDPNSFIQRKRVRAPNTNTHKVLQLRKNPNPIKPNSSLMSSLVSQPAISPIVDSSFRSIPNVVDSTVQQPQNIQPINNEEVFHQTCSITVNPNDMRNLQIVSSGNVIMNNVTEPLNNNTIEEADVKISVIQENENLEKQLVNGENNINPSDKSVANETKLKDKIPTARIDVNPLSNNQNNNSTTSLFDATQPIIISAHDQLDLGERTPPGCSSAVYRWNCSLQLVPGPSPLPSKYYHL